MELSFDAVLAGLKYGALLIAALTVFVSYLLRRQLVTHVFKDAQPTAGAEARLRTLVDYFKHSDKVATLVLVIAVVLQLAELGIRRLMPDMRPSIVEHDVVLRVEAEERIADDLKPRFFQDNLPLAKAAAGVYSTKVRQPSSFAVDVNALRERIRDLVSDNSQRERQHLQLQLGIANSPLGPGEPGQ